MPHVVNEVHLFLAIDEDGDEGLAAYYDRATKTWLPLVCSDVVRLEIYKRMAQELCDASGIEITIIKMTTRSEVETLSSRRSEGV